MTRGEDYWQVRSDILEQIKLRFDEADLIFYTRNRIFTCINPFRKHSPTHQLDFR